MVADYQSKEPLPSLSSRPLWHCRLQRHSSDRRASNPPPSGWEPDVLPDELRSQSEQVMGIEPTTTWLEARSSTAELHLQVTRLPSTCLASLTMRPSSTDPREIHGRSASPTAPRGSFRSASGCRSRFSRLRTGRTSQRVLMRHQRHVRGSNPSRRWSTTIRPPSGPT